MAKRTLIKTGQGILPTHYMEVTHLQALPTCINECHSIVCMLTGTHAPTLFMTSFSCIISNELYLKETFK